MIPYWFIFSFSSVLGAYVPWTPSSSVRDVVVLSQLVLVLFLGSLSGLPGDLYCGGNGSGMSRRAGSTYCPYLVTLIGMTALRTGQATSFLITCSVLYCLLVFYQVGIYNYVRHVEDVDRRVRVLMNLIYQQERPVIHQVLGLTAVEDPADDWECSICLESAPMDGLSKRSCDHVFHTECATMAAIQDPRCPLCRRLPDQLTL